MTIKEALSALDLKPGASKDEVKRAYRKKMPQVHPDLATDDADRERRERAATQLNVANRTVQTFGTSLPTCTSRPRTQSASPSSSTAEKPSEPATNPSRPGSSKQPSNPAEERTAPSTRPAATSEPLRPTPSGPSGVGSLTSPWDFGFAAWLTIFRAAPAVLLSVALRGLGFWSSFLAGTSLAAPSPTGLWAVAVGAITLLVVFFVSAWGGARGSTKVLSIAIVLYCSYYEVLLNFGWGANVSIFILVVVAPVLRRLLKK